MKAAISENLLSAFGIAISLVLIFIMASMMFGNSSKEATEASYRSIARDIAGAIDRIGGEAGSAVLQYEIPAGQNVDIEIGYRNVIVSSAAARQEAFFSALRNHDTQIFEKPRSLCFIKSRFDRSITARASPCRCNSADSVCDPECIAEGICDAGCRSPQPDSICNPLCSAPSDNICDPDCYRNSPDTVWDADCKQLGGDGICDPDSAVSDGYCDQDCLGREGFCDADCPGYTAGCGLTGGSP